MSDNMTVTPATVGLGAAVIGAGIGYSVAPRKYNLENLLTIESDVFKKTIPNEVEKKASDVQKTALSKIKNARESIKDARNNKTFDNVLRGLLENESLKADYKSIKTMIPKERLYATIIGAVVAGLVGILGKLLFGNVERAKPKSKN